MTKKIFKFPLEPQASQVFYVPAGAKLLHIDNLGGEIFIWAIVDPDQPKYPQIIHIYGTGADLPPNAGTYLNTFQFPDSTLGPLVFHAFY